MKLNPSFRQNILTEFEQGTYERFVRIQPDDFVLDLGCSHGYLYYYYQNVDFTYVGVEANKSSVLSFSESLEPRDRATVLNFALGDSDNSVIEFDEFFEANKKDKTATITFGSLLSLFNRKIDFLKFDVEGWEISIFGPDSYDLFKRNVTRFSGEWHFTGVFVDGKKVRSCLDRLLNDKGVVVRLFSVDGTDITDSFRYNANMYTEITCAGYVVDPYSHVPKFLLRTMGNYLGQTSLNNHLRDFTRALSLRYENLCSRCWNVSDDEDRLLDSLDRKLLKERTYVDQGEYQDSHASNHPTWSGLSDPNCVNIVLAERGHHYLHNPPQLGHNIAYIHWESTLLPDDYFTALLEFKQLWVPSKWQRDCVVAQGYPFERVRIMPVGVPEDCFQTAFSLTPTILTLIVVGAWSYRKATKEVIESILTALPTESIEIKLLVDAPHSPEGNISIRDRLSNLGIQDPRIKVIPFLESREDYIHILSGADIFVSCSRGEGWNIPLMEAIACGVPAIFSDCSGQTEFTKGYPLRVKADKLLPVNLVPEYSDLKGSFHEPDFKHLVEVIKDAYTNHAYYKKLYRGKSAEFRAKYSWSRVVEQASRFIDVCPTHQEPVQSDDAFVRFFAQPKLKPRPISDNSDIQAVHFGFVLGPKVEILGTPNGKLVNQIEIIDQDTNYCYYSTSIANNNWAQADRKYYTNWLIRVLREGKVIREHAIDLKGKRVFINFESQALGDTIAWIPAAVAFKAKHECSLIVSTYWNRLFAPYYPNIEFVEPGVEVTNLYAQFPIGCFNVQKRDWSPRPWNLLPLQQVATQLLGLPSSEERPRISRLFPDRPTKFKYVCISTKSTADAKEWNNPDGWKVVSSKLKSLGLTVIDLSPEASPIEGVKRLPAGDISRCIQYLDHCEFFIGLSSGLSWLAWALYKEVVLISGFTEPYVEFKKCARVSPPPGTCSGCCNRFVFDPGVRDWCPDFHKSPRKFECTKLITPDMVWDKVLTLKAMKDTLKQH